METEDFITDEREVGSSQRIKAVGYQKRKQKEFEIVYRNYQHAIYKVGLYYTKDELVAEEITQKVFYELYLHFDGAKVKHMYSYLHQAARNTAYNWAKKHKRLVYPGNVQILQEQEHLVAISLEDIYMREQQKLAAKALSECILERLRQENESWHQAIWLVYGLEKSYGQVAKELGISKDVLSSRLHRANKWIRKHYREAYDDVMSWPC